MQRHSAPPATSTTHQLVAEPRKVRLSFRKRSTDVEKAGQHDWRFATTVESLHLSDLRPRPLAHLAFRSSLPLLRSDCLLHAQPSHLIHRIACTLHRGLLPPAVPLHRIGMPALVEHGVQFATAVSARLSVTAGNWLSQHGGRSSTGRETVLPRRQKPYPPCVLSSPRGEVALPCHRARATAQRQAARAPSPPSPAVARPAPTGPSSLAKLSRSQQRLPSAAMPHLPLAAS